MKKLNNKTLAALLAALVFVVVAVVFFIRRKKKAEEADNAIAGGGSSTTSGVATFPTASFPLTPYSMAKEYTTSAGSYGQQIANLQKICNERFDEKLVVDGKLGPKSEAAFLKCFGYPILFPYSEAVYNGLMLQYGGGLNLA